MKSSSVITIPASDIDPSVWIAKAMTAAGFAVSSSAAKNMIKTGRVHINDKPITDEMHRFARGEKFNITVGEKSASVEIA